MANMLMCVLLYASPFCSLCVCGHMLRSTFTDVLIPLFASKDGGVDSPLPQWILFCLSLSASPFRQGLCSVMHVSPPRLFLSHLTCDRTELG